MCARRQDEAVMRKKRQENHNLNPTGKFRTNNTEINVLTRIMNRSDIADELIGLED